MTINNEVLKNLKGLLSEEALAITDIRAHLTIAKIKGKAQDEYIDELKESGSLSRTTRSGGFADEYYSWLSAEVRTEKEATAFIEGTGDYGETSDNVKKHKGHYLNIQKLTETIWTK